MKLKGSFGNFSKFTVDGVEGEFICKTQRMFTHVVHWVDGRRIGLVCNVSAGSIIEGGRKSAPNRSKSDQIRSALKKYIENFATELTN